MVCKVYKKCNKAFVGRSQKTSSLKGEGAGGSPKDGFTNKVFKSKSDDGVVEGNKNL